jgi:hypothetical protein
MAGRDELRLDYLFFQVLCPSSISEPRKIWVPASCPGDVGLALEYLLRAPPFSHYIESRKAARLPTMSIACM